ncbi:MAG: DUF456 domain-containing protein [Actinomycetota bacterium]
MGEGDVFWTVVVAVVMVIGLAGVVVPVVPGLLLMWVAALLYGFAVGWSGLGIGVMVVLSVLVVTSLILGVIVPRRAAADSGASGLAQVGALIGAVVGFFVIPLVGVIVGAVVGLLIVEYLRNDDWDLAWTAAKGTLRGFGISILIDLGLGLVMLTAWSVWAATVLF